MANDHVAEPFRSVLNGFAGVKPSLQNQKVSNRSRYAILAGLQAELEAAGTVIDVSQLDWVTREVERRLFEASLDQQFKDEQARRQRAVDEADDWDRAERRSRDAQRARS